MHSYSNKWQNYNNLTTWLSLNLSRVPPTLVEAESLPPQILGAVSLRRDYKSMETPIPLKHWGTV